MTPDPEVAWRPEVELLVASARPALSGATGDRIRALARGITEWPDVLRMAGEHGIRPLLYRSLNAVCADLVPEAVLDELRGFVQTDAARNLFQNVELLSLLEGFSHSGIPAIPFKGGVLASWVYGDPALRESGDLDIVIRTPHIRDAMALLVSHGYGPREPEAREASRYLRFDRTDGLASVDLQDSLEAPHFSFPLDVDELWDRARPREFAGQNVLSFCADDLLILLCVHGTKDVWFKLKWIGDIAAFVEQERGLDWGDVLSRAAHLRAIRKLLLGCLLARELLGAPVPEEISSRIRKEPRVRAAAEAVIRRLSAGGRTITGAERAALYFMTDDPWDRARRGLGYVRRSLRVMVVPSDDDRRSLHLPRWLSSAYYLVRPIRLTAKYGTGPRVAVKALRELFESLD